MMLHGGDAVVHRVARQTVLCETVAERGAERRVVVHDEHGRAWVHRTMVPAAA